MAYIAKTRDSSKSNLYTVQANGLSRHQLSEKLDVSQTVVWSKNGRKLAFVSNDDRDSSETNIYVVNADGSRLTQVFSGTGSDSDYVCKGGTSYSIGWTSNDRKLIFTRVCDGINDPGVFSLYVSDTTGIKGTKLIKKWNSDTISHLSLSPNAKQVIFFKDKNIYKMNIDGLGLAKLSDTPSPSNFGITWSPDSKLFAFSSGKPSHLGIYVVNVEKKTLKNLTNEPQKEAYDGFISWSPNGTQLVYYQNQGRNQHGIQLDINLLDINSGSVRKITQKPGQYSNLTWSPDGKQIAFTNGDFSQNNLYVMYINSLKSIQIAPTLPVLKTLLGNLSLMISLKGMKPQ